MNTVGKVGKLGEHVRCVVSVSMLTEGWDAQTVTHILGIRAFGTQLLCEQVVGRALRRTSYAADENGMFQPEYAEVYGVPFSFIPTSGGTTIPQPGSIPTRVRALEDRSECEITFPRVLGYRFDLGEERLEARFTSASKMVFSTRDLPTKVEVAPIVGETSIHDLDALKAKREHEVAFNIAKLTLERFFKDGEGNDRPWLFPDLLSITKRWMKEYVICKDDAFPQLLILTENMYNAAERIHLAIAMSAKSEPYMLPMLAPYDTVGSTKYVDFDTLKDTFVTDPKKCHVSHVAADTGSWEQKLAYSLEEMEEVVRYVKNEHLDFAIPYDYQGKEANYLPDFIAVLMTSSRDELNLIIEVTGQRRVEKEAKVAATKGKWVPAVNNHGGFGRWAFIEITDPWNAKSEIRAFVSKLGGKKDG
jgi:type III restriction enzyme